MKIFCDYHHGGLARSMFYLWGKRLHHSIKFPSVSMAEKVDPVGSTWGRMDDTYPKTMGGIDPTEWERFGGTVSYEEFMDTAWDIILFTRTESQELIRNLDHPNTANTVWMGQSGNENMQYEWGKVSHLLSSDMDTMRNSPPWTHKLLVGQELGSHYGRNFRFPLQRELITINCFINNIRGQESAHRWSANDWGTGCPHCGERHSPSDHVNLWDLWRQTGDVLRDTHRFAVYGHSNDDLCGGVNLRECDMPAIYDEGALTWHVKGFDGWGHSMLQSIACGRPVIVEKRFYKYRTAGRYLIPGTTCIEVDYDSASAVNQIREVTADWAAMEEMCDRCYKVAKVLFNWAEEAARVQRWLDRTI